MRDWFQNLKLRYHAGAATLGSSTREERSNLVAEFYTFAPPPTPKKQIPETPLNVFKPHFVGKLMSVPFADK